MVRLTEKSKTGLWHLRGVSWEQLRTGHKITKTVSEKIYGALCKLKDYEDSGSKSSRKEYSDGTEGNAGLERNYGLRVRKLRM